MADYETYETDAVYDEMDFNPTVKNAPPTKEAAPPPPKRENENGNSKMKILLAVALAVIVLLLFAVGGGVGLLLKSNFMDSADCDVGPWGSWTSCYLPPRTCGIGSKNRTRKKRADAQNLGEKCAELRIIELTEMFPCNVACTPLDCEVGPWGNWTSCSVTCGGGTKERTRPKIAEAVNDGAECASARNFIPLTEQTTCNEDDCPPDVKLIGGSGPHEGNIFVDGLPVCDDHHDAENALVVCRMLGYASGQHTIQSKFGSVPATFAMDDVKCLGNEASILDCPHLTQDDCGVGEGAGVICRNS